MPDNVHPTAVIVQRIEPARDRSYTPQSNERLAVRVDVETAPTPPQDTIFAGVGRDAQHSTPHIFRYNHLAIADIQSHMAPNFTIPRVLGAVVIGMPRGAFIPAVERPNIQRPDQTTVGDEQAIQSPLVVNNRLAKLA